MLFAGLESVHMVKDCDIVLENAARGRRPRAAFSRPRSQFFTIRADRKPVNNMFIYLFFPAVNWFYRLQMGSVVESAYAPSTDDLQKSRQQASNSDSRQRKMY